MKRLTILIALIAAIISHSATAQTTAQLQAKIDSLETRLGKLQHDFDYVKILYELKILDNEINISANKVNIRTNDIDKYVIGKSFDRSARDMYKRLYTTYCDDFNATEDTFNTLSDYAYILIEYGNLTETETNLLLVTLKSISGSLAVYKAALDAMNGFLNLK